MRKYKDEDFRKDLLKLVGFFEGWASMYEIVREEKDKVYGTLNKYRFNQFKEYCNKRFNLNLK